MKRIKVYALAIFAAALVGQGCKEESATTPPAATVKILVDAGTANETRVDQITVNKGSKVQFVIQGVTAQYVSILPFGQSVADFRYDELYRQASNHDDSVAVRAIGTAGQALQPSFFTVVPGADYSEGIFTQQYDVVGVFHPKVITTNVSLPRSADLKRNYSNDVTVTVVP